MKEQKKHFICGPTAVVNKELAMMAASSCACACQCGSQVGTGNGGGSGGSLLDLLSF